MDIPQALRNNPIEGGFWDIARVHGVFLATEGERSLRSTERWLDAATWLPKAVSLTQLQDEDGRGLKSAVVDSLQAVAKRKRQPVFFLQIVSGELGSILVFNDGRLSRQWCFLPPNYTIEHVADALALVVGDKSVLVWPFGSSIELFREWVAQAKTHNITLSSGARLTIGLSAFHQPKSASISAVLQKKSASPNAQPAGRLASSKEMTHLDRLEAESIHIMREVVAQAENPVMLYSVGKDSSVMLHLARKAFYPNPPPFPLMHVDTRWKFQAMYDFRDYMAKESGMELIVHVNPEGVAKNINPFDHGSAIHTDVMKTQGLKQALDEHGFDVAFGGARRDEEKSRAKERIFSFRNANHRWDPKNQRPELWNLYNGYKNPGESIRVFPLSNWTELDIWQYIYREQIPIVPLYFAAERPVVERDGMLVMVDDDRIKLAPGEQIESKLIRFRTLGCYPLTGAVESDADDLSSIVLELLNSRTSEREGRAIDSDSSASMEKKKQEGYF
jgi:sulfate adenylyltransferase subunit 2